MELKKNQEYIVDIVDYGYQGEGIAKIDGITVFVEGVLKEETVKILIVKVTSSFAYGKVLNIIKPSICRQKEDCITYKRCGGCDLRHIKYEETLKIKTQVVENCINKQMKQKFKVDNIIGMENPIGYRNKLQYPIGLSKAGKPQIGVFAERSHEIIPTHKCSIQNSICEDIAKDVFKFIVDNNISIYDEKKLSGLVRHVVIRIGINTNEIMVILVVSNNKLPKEKEVANYLTSKYSNIKTVIKNINSRNTNVILGNSNETIYGDGYIYDTLENYKFKISPLSFYQTNPIQAEVLYKKSLEFADLKGDETAFDLYCGIGTISLFIAKHVKKVYGIEVVEDAIKNAKDNATLNNVKNAEFIAGEVEVVLPKLVEEENVKADVVFLDPPRSGCDNVTIETLLKLNPTKIIYISCNPATLARDLRMLSEKYEIKKIQPVDMFPYTHHIECVVLLTLE